MSNVEDNDGITAVDYAQGNSKILDLLDKNKEKKIRKKEKMAARKDKLRDTCSSCKSATKKRCGGCFIEIFYSRECQEKEWSAHKVLCHNRKREYIGFEFVRIFRYSNVGSLNNLLEYMRIVVKPSKPDFIVKIQIDVDPEAMILHNSDMSHECGEEH